MVFATRVLVGGPYGSPPVDDGLAGMEYPCKTASASTARSISFGSRPPSRSRNSRLGTSLILERPDKRLLPRSEQPPVEIAPRTTPDEIKRRSFAAERLSAISGCPAPARTRPLLLIQGIEQSANIASSRVASVSHGIAVNVRKFLICFGFALCSFATRARKGKRR